MAEAETEDDAGNGGILEKLQSMLTSVTEGARSVKAAGQQKVADRRDQRERDALLRELGELYYDALSAGKDQPTKKKRDRVMADLDELQRRSESDPDEKGSTDAGS